MTFPGGGADVGTAYVRILADGNGLDQSIRDEFKQNSKTDRALRDLGQEHSKSYREGWDDEQSKRPLLGPTSPVYRDMLRQKGRFRAVADSLGSDFGTRLRETIEKQVGSKQIADRIFRDISNEALSGGGFDSIRKNLGRITELQAKAVTDLQGRQARLEALNKQQADRAVVEYKKRLDKLSQILEDHDKKDVANTRASFQSRLDSAVKALTESGNKSLLNDLDTDLTRFTRHAEQGQVKVQGFFRTTLREMSPAEQRMAKFVNEADKVSEALGTGFGKGNRNNFFNALGSIVEGIGKVTIGAGPRLLAFLTEVKEEFKDGAKAGGTFSDSLANVGDVIFNNVNQVGNFLLKGLAGAVGGIAAFVSVASPLIALLSSLAAGVVALAGVLSFALVGAIGTVAPLILPLAASIGVLTLAFANMSTTAKKKLAAEFTPLIKQFQQLRAITQEKLFSRIDQDVKAFSPTLARLEPLLSGVANAMSLSFDRFIKSLNTRGFTAFIKTMQTFLPQSILKLGDVADHVFLGMAGLFRALAPFALKFLDTIDSIAKRFDVWANSAKGQNSITKFMHEAGQAASAVWGVLVSLSKTLFTLLAAGNKPGQGFLGSITSTLTRFSDWLRSPAGQKGLDVFFARMKDTFSAMGKLADGVGKLYGALNSKLGQTILTGTLKLIGAAFLALARLIPTITAFVGSFGKVVLTVVSPIFSFLSSHIGIVKAIGIALGILYVQLKAISLLRAGTTFLSNTISALGSRATAVGLSGTGAGLGIVARNLESTSVAVRGLQGVLGGAIGGVAVGTLVKSGGIGGWLESILGGAGLGAAAGAPGGLLGAGIGALVGGVTGALAHLKGLMDNHANDAKSAAAKAAAAWQAEQQHVDDLTQALLGANGAIDQQTKLMIAQGLQKGGQFDQLKQLQGLSPQVGSLTTADLTNAAAGNASALAKMNKVFDAAIAANPLLIDQIGKLRQAITGSSEDVVTATSKYLELNEALKQNFLATRSVKDETKLFGTSLDTATASGLVNNQFIIDHVNALKAAAAANVAHGQSLSVANAKLYEQVNALRAQLISAGYSKTAVDQLLTSLGLLKPKDIPITANTKPAKVSVDSFMASLPPAGRIAIQLLTQSAKFDLNAFLNQIPNSVNVFVHVRGLTGQLTASGGVFAGAQERIIGEAGPEAVVPLNRPLSQVDPAVRWLSAVAQGLAPPPFGGKAMANGGISTGGKVVNVQTGAIMVVSPQADPAAVAQETLNRMVAKL